MTKPIDLDLIDRYLAGEATDHESEALRARARQEPALAALLGELKSTGHDWSTDVAWSRVQQQTRRSGRLPRWALAAAAVFVVGAGITVLQREWQDEPPASSIASREYTTSAGVRLTVALPDGSTVTLAPRSRMVVPVSFEAGERMVRLYGAAFFDVKPDATRPFVVAAQGTITRVLGTTFSVSAYADQPSVEVLVVTGRVLVRPERATAGAELDPGERARTDSVRVLAVDTIVDPGDYTAWREGRLVFRNVTLAEAAPRLERWYGIDLRVPDAALAATRFTAYLGQQQLDDVLDVLAATLNAHYERTDTIITFHPRQ